MNTYDNISLKRIETAHPAIKEKLLSAFKEASEAITGSVFLRLAYVRRSFDEQTALYALGRTVLFANGIRQGIVTYAQAGQSFHNYGLAFDIVLIHKNQPKAEYDFAVDFDSDSEADYMEAVRIFKKNGFEWGGDWLGEKKDKPHFQMVFGYSWRDLYKKYTQKDFIKDDFVRI